MTILTSSTRCSEDDVCLGFCIFIFPKEKKPTDYYLFTHLRRSFEKLTSNFTILDKLDLKLFVLAMTLHVYIPHDWFTTGIFIYIVQKWIYSLNMCVTQFSICVFFFVVQLLDSRIWSCLNLLLFKCGKNYYTLNIWFKTMPVILSFADKSISSCDRCTKIVSE